MPKGSPIFGRFKATQIERHRSKKKPDLLTPQHCREAQRQIRILEAIADKPGITVSEISMAINDPPFLIRKALEQFIENQSVYCFGKDIEDHCAQYFLRTVEVKKCP